MSDETFNNADLAAAFFGDIKAVKSGGKIICKRGCGKYITKPKSGYTAFTYHIQSQVTARVDVCGRVL